MKMQFQKLLSLKNLALHLQLSGTHCRYDATCVNHVTFGDFLLYWESTLLFVTILDRDPDNIPGRKLHKHPSSWVLPQKELGIKTILKTYPKQFLNFERLILFFIHSSIKGKRLIETRISMVVEVQMRFCKRFGFFVFQEDGRKFGTFLLRYYITFTLHTVRHP